ncbi:helix-loop-helix DNA-binding domain-containing protein [Phycomyces nitens]|nr:helix-loop-helix DNA-binding domain-containing protein [Phycomyces nitens]
MDVTTRDPEFFLSPATQTQDLAYPELGDKFSAINRQQQLEEYYENSGQVMKRSATLQPNGTFGHSTAQYRHHNHQQDPGHEHHDFMFYPSSAASLDQRYRSFAGSAPANIGYNHMHQPSFGDSVPVAEDGAVDATSFAIPPSLHKTNPKKYPHERTARKQAKTGSPQEGDNYDDMFAAQANLQAIMEKRRRRRESHNAVERRRRDNINDRIQELGTLLPDLEEDGVNRLNKGTILRKSVDQIKQLQRDVNQCQQRVHELETLLKQVSRQRPPSARLQQH